MTNEAYVQDSPGTVENWISVHKFTLSPHTEAAVWKLSGSSIKRMYWLNLGCVSEGQGSVWIFLQWDGMTTGHHSFMVGFVLFFFYLVGLMLADASSGPQHWLTNSLPHPVVPLTAHPTQLPDLSSTHWSYSQGGVPPPNTLLRTPGLNQVCTLPSSDW